MRPVARILLFVPPVVLLAAGCATTEKYAPPRYQAAQDRFGAIRLATGKTLYVCPAIDSLTPENRALLKPEFSPWEYATAAIEQELKASGLKPVRAALAFGPGFDSLRRVLAEKANHTEKAVYLGTELLVLSSNHLTLDAKLLDPAGAILFEKRGLCVVFDASGTNVQEVTHMSMRQILADPKFQEALQR
ncbi:MAG: hypothetical protein WCI17_10150 [bacterium]